MKSYLLDEDVIKEYLGDPLFPSEDRQRYYSLQAFEVVYFTESSIRIGGTSNHDACYIGDGNTKFHFYGAWSLQHVQEAIRRSYVRSFTISRTNVAGYTDETTMLPAFVMYGYMSHDDDTSGSPKLYFSEEFINIFNLQEPNKRAAGNEDDIATIERAVAFNWATIKKLSFRYHETLRKFLSMI